MQRKQNYWESDVGKKKRSRSRVSDADIARAAGGETARDERSKSCRDFLKTMLDETQHKVVFTKAIQAEWNKHQSLMAQTWRSTMIAQKRYRPLDASADNELRHNVEQCASNDNKREIMLKDIHLIEAAFQTDKIVAS